MQVCLPEKEAPTWATTRSFLKVRATAEFDDAATRREPAACRNTKLRTQRQQWTVVRRVVSVVHVAGSSEGRLGETGQVFFLNGCDGNASGRKFLSRTFAISIAPN